jgi:hypothetical protein
VRIIALGWKPGIAVTREQNAECGMERGPVNRIPSSVEMRNPEVEGKKTMGGNLYGYYLSYNVGASHAVSHRRAAG